ncbi:MAG TPA: serine hydrolase, partial [Rhizomicrobium sp.]|nr:serine hydrolase [Rhizomicrobium sp.]
MAEMNRRSLLLAAAGVMAAGPVLGRPNSDAQAMTAAFAELERRGGGRLGVAVRDSQSGATLSWRADERFFLCSTFKLLAVAALLKRVDDGAENLDRTIAYGAGDMVSYAPVTE